MRGSLPVPILVERQIEEQLTATRIANRAHAYADALAFSFTSDYPDYPDIGTLKGHVHAGLEIGMVLTGEIEVFLSDREALRGATGRQRTGALEPIPHVSFTCGPGCVWLCNAWEPHAWRVNVPDTINLAFIFLPELLGGPRPLPHGEPEKPALTAAGASTLGEAEGRIRPRVEGEPPLLALFTSPPSRRPRVTDEGLRQQFLSIAADLRREMDEKPPFWQAKVRLDLLLILLELARLSDQGLSEQGQHENSRSGPTEANWEAAPGVVNRILPAVKLAYGSPSHRVTVDEAAKACALSPSRFHHLFRRTMGVSFGTFCLQARLAYVAHQLLYTDHSVGAVAMEAGFVDVSHLCHVFGKHYGCTPGEYRDQCRRSGSVGP